MLALFTRFKGSFLTPENETDRLSRNVGKNHYTLRNNPELRRSRIQSACLKCPDNRTIPIIHVQKNFQNRTLSLTLSPCHP